MRARSTGPEAQKALGELVGRYERSVIAIVRAYPYPPDSTVEDLKQEFFFHVLRRRDLDKLDGERGRFRNWLHCAVRNFVKNEWAKWHAERNGKSVTAAASFHVRHEMTPERQFMRQFAEDTVLYALRRQRDQARDKERFDRWARFLPGPQLDLCDLKPLADALGMSPNHVAVQIHKAREEHKRVLREVIADTLDVDLSNPEGERAVALELESLYRALCESPRNEIVVEDA